MPYQLHSNVSLEDGYKNLRSLIQELANKSLDWNEADTRFHIIDRLLVECLGWHKEQRQFKLEYHSDGEFCDYVLGDPGSVIWEAKRTGKYFDFPADSTQNTVTSLRGIFAVSDTAEKAIRQVRLLRFPSFRYKSELQTNLRTISELLLEDIISTEPLKPQFYRECYCDTNALSRDALVSEQILKARYAALFPPAEDAPQLVPAPEAATAPSLAQQIATEALSRRPIVLLGDVGVGKTSFLEDLMYVRAPDEFRRSITLYIDFASKAALDADIRKFVLSEFERQLYTKYEIDIFQDNFVRGVYDLEVKRFRSSFKAAYYRSNRPKLEEQLIARLNELVDDKPEHLRRSIDHVAKARQRQVIVMIDNADQRAIEIQQQAFITAQDFAQNWNAIVFIAVRPLTFFQSKRAGTFAAYPHKVFTISPPRADPQSC
jgi:hypothetical protein